MHPLPSMKLPKNDEPEPFWIYQATWVDLQSLKPALTAAFTAAGIPPRKKPSDFTPRVALPKTEPTVTKDTSEGKESNGDAAKTSKTKGDEMKDDAKHGQSTGNKGKGSTSGGKPEEPATNSAEPPEVWTGIVTR